MRAFDLTKLVRPDPKYWERDDYGYWCPACDEMHTISVAQKNHSGASWSFNGNFVRPTFKPSINYRVNTPDMKDYQADAGSKICHHFITDGMIQFCSDCTHALRGQTVKLPDFPVDELLTCNRLS
jgi:Family of unknown function (DUF6527)